MNIYELIYAHPILAMLCSLLVGGFLGVFYLWLAAAIKAFLRFEKKDTKNVRNLN